MKPSRAGLPIGVFDSGIGGLTVARALRRALPREDLVYLGDTARVPYGTKSPATVVRFAREDACFLLEQKVKAIVVACNTASAWALPALEREFDLPIFGVIFPGARAAVARSRNGRIGVIGTRATIRSEAYRRAILELAPEAVVLTQACPLLVPLVEEGWTNHLVTATILREYLRQLLDEGVDTLVLGCTHYPLLKPAIRAVAGSEVALIDSAASCSRYVRDRLTALGLLAERRVRKGTFRPFVTDDAAHFGALARRFLGGHVPAAEKAELPTLG